MGLLWICVLGRDMAVGMQARKQLDKKRRASTTVCMNRLAGQLPMMHNNAHPLRASLRAGDRSQQIMQPALWQQHSGLCVDSSPAVKILAVATLIYHNAMPNGPVLVDIVFQVLENALPTLPSLRRAGGPWGVINTLRTASPGTRRHRRQQQTALVWRRLPSSP